MFGVGSEGLADLMACRSGLPTFPISHAMHSVIQAHLASEVPHWTLWAWFRGGRGRGEREWLSASSPASAETATRRRLVQRRRQRSERQWQQGEQ